MTIEELLAATGLTANDLVPIYDAEAAQNVEPTQKVTATQLAAAVKVLADLQGKLTFDSTPTSGSANPVTSAGIATAIQQSTASGSNANGTYVKFVDGTMICYTIISPFLFTANSTRTETRNFPAAFTTAPAVTLNINTTIPDKLSLSCYGVSTTQYVLNAVSTFSADQGPTVWMMAIGRWK